MVTNRACAREVSNVQELDADLLEQAVYGGLFYGAGGTGLEDGLRLIELAREVGPIKLASLDELPPNTSVVIQTGVGAPGVKQRLTWLRDHVRALNLFIEALPDETIAATMPGHPSAHMVGAWICSALAHPEIVVVDCAGNGRGHPTVAMGGMGQLSALEACWTQVGVGGDPAVQGHVEVMARGPMGNGSATLHAASASVGGALAACRGPFSVAMCKRNGAVGAISACLAVGASMVEARAASSERAVGSILEAAKGVELGRGRVVSSSIALVRAWDVGQVAVECDIGLLELTVCNEFMCVDRRGERLATFPDLIVVVAPDSGLPLSAAGLRTGDEVVIGTVPRERVPLGAGVWDRSAYVEVEALTGKELASYLEGGHGAR